VGADVRRPGWYDAHTYGRSDSETLDRVARAEIVVDLDAVRDNVATLRRRVDRPLMAVV